MKKLLLILISIILVVLCYLVIRNDFKIDILKSKIPTNIIETKNIPSTDDIINYLCSETIADRAIGTKGNELSTIYIENLFKNLELDTVFSDSYLNNFYYESENLYLSNVVGKLNGRNNKKAIIITSHFDAWCNGALDNASGVATSFRILNSLKEDIYTIPLKYDVVFCMTNAEMAQFIGSQSFVNDVTPLYDEMYNINIDCVGAKNGGPLALNNISRIEESTILYDTLKKILSENDIDYSNSFSSDKVEYCFNNNSGVSDYFSFEEKNIPNIHIAQEGISDLILNDNDDPENLDFTEINLLGDVLAKFIQQINLD